MCPGVGDSRGRRVEHVLLVRQLVVDAELIEDVGVSRPNTGQKHRDAATLQPTDGVGEDRGSGRVQ